MMSYLISLKLKIKNEVENEYHGVGGPLSISNQRMSLPLLNEFQKCS